MVKTKSICSGKRTSNPNKCKKISSCKVASGKKRTFCRKKHNKTKKGSPKTRRVKRRSEVARLKGHSRKVVKELKKLR
jgi:hypothetical protein